MNQLILQRSGLSLEALREVVGEAFDIALEVSSLSDGRLRVTRIAELGGSDAPGVITRDLFLFTANAPGGDGSFSATGVVPRIANELAARGMKLDGALFKAAHGRAPRTARRARKTRRTSSRDAPSKSGAAPSPRS